MKRELPPEVMVVLCVNGEAVGREHVRPVGGVQAFAPSAATPPRSAHQAPGAHPTHSHQCYNQVVHIFLLIFLFSICFVTLWFRFRFGFVSVSFIR